MQSTYRELVSIFFLLCPVNHILVMTSFWLMNSNDLLNFYKISYWLNFISFFMFKISLGSLVQLLLIH